MSNVLSWGIGVVRRRPVRPSTLRSARSFMSTTRPQLHPPRIDAELVAVVQVVVEHGGQEVVGQLDGVDVAGEVEVDVLHRDHLGVAAAGRPALHAEARSHRRLAEADGCPVADPVQPVGQADAGGRLALAGRRGGDRGHEDEFSGRGVVQAMVQIERDLGLHAAVVLQIFGADAQLGGDLVDRRASWSARAISMSGGKERAGVSVMGGFRWKTRASGGVVEHHSTSQYNRSIGSARRPVNNPAA